LLSLGIPLDEIEKTVSSTFFEPKEERIITLEQVTKVSLYTPEVKLPPLSVRMTGENFRLENAYLQSRKLDVNNYPFYVSSDKKYKQRIIIPFYKYGKVIYWQARTIVNDKLRYLNCEVSKAAVLFGFDRLYANQQTNLFVTEGVTDALGVNGVALIGSKLNDTKIELLRQTKRPLIFIIDGDDNGRHLAEQVIEHELGQITQTGTGLDVNKSIVRYGKLWTYYRLMENVAKTKLEQKLLIKGLSR
jgi:hypothetical protein